MLFFDNEKIMAVFVERLQHKAEIVVSHSVDRTQELVKEATEEKAHQRRKISTT